MRILLSVICLILAMGAARAEIPYRYPVQKGFILAVDDASRQAVPRSDPLARAVVDALAAVLVSDRFRIPVEYGRTLAWHVGEEPADGQAREDLLQLFNEARGQDAARAQPANVLFLRIGRRGGMVRLRIDWVDVVRGESKTRYVSPGGALSGVASVDALAPFFEEVAKDLLDRLGPAPPRGYGDVPPAWLIDPIVYRVEFRSLPEGIRLKAYDAMVIEFPYYIADRLLEKRGDRLAISYETRAPSWWLAERLRGVFDALDYAVKIEPRTMGLRIEPAG